MHTGTAPTNNDKTSVNYLSAFNTTSNPSSGLYLTPKTEYPIINDVSNGSCYQTNLYSYNQNSFNNTTSCASNNYDQAAINRRKNATRETTNTLKAWLYEHRKNPYPTKGEKIMLAIITKMTLTQVSTWFANARRRLKKENKMTWSPRNKCNSGSNDEDDSSDIEYASNENENNEITTDINEDSRVTNNKRLTVDKSDQDEDMINNGQSNDLNRSINVNKCDDSDSNTSIKIKRNTPPSNYETNNYGKGETANYLTNEQNYHDLENHHSDRFFPYHHNRTTTEFSYSTNRDSHPSQYHIAYSTSGTIQIPPVTNLAYAQSQINETSIYNQLHSHHYHNVHAPQTTAHHSSNLPTTQRTVQQQLSQQQQQQQQTNPNLATPVGQQNQESSLQHPVYHHVPNLNAHPNASYSLLQSSYPSSDYMLAHHNTLHQTSSQQLTQNPPLYYPTANSLTQLPSQVQSTTNNLRNSVVENSLYSNHLSLAKPITTSNPLNETSKSDENNNLETSTNVSLSAVADNSVLENTRKIWSLAQTATDSHSINSLGSSNNTASNSLNQGATSPARNSTIIENTSAATYIDSTSEQQQPTTNISQQLVKGHSSPNSVTTALQLSTYMNSQLANNTNTNSNSSLDSSSMLTNNQLTSYNNNSNHHHYHQNYPSIDCGQLAHNSNTFLGKVFFDYISTGTTGPLEHDRNWTRIGLL